MDSIFDLFNLDDLAKKLEDLKVLATDKYNDFVNNNFKKYDVTTDEGYQAFVNEAADIRKQLSESDGIFSQKLISVLDKFVEDAYKAHKEATEKRNTNKDINANRNIDDLVHAEVTRNVKENNGRINKNDSPIVEKNDNIDWPSEKLTSKQKRNVWKLVDEYMDTKVIPYLEEDFDDDLVDDMSSGLFEFAAWILTKEED